MTQRLRLVLCTSGFLSTLIFTGCGGNFIPPQSSGAAPAVSATAVQVNGVAPNRSQEVQFSQAMNSATINAETFLVTDASGTRMPGAVSYDADFDIASFQPTPALKPGAAYTATVTTGAKNAQGVPLARAYSYTFQTRAATDSSPLEVLSVSPAANATCVAAKTPVIVTFDEAPDAATVTAGNFAVTAGGNPVPVSLSINASTTQVVLTPTAALPSGTITVTVNNLADLAGVKMTAPYTWSFSTACTGGGGTGGAQYQAPLFSEASGGVGTMMDGNVMVDGSGMTSIQLTGAPAATTYTVQFCPGFDSGATTIQAPACINVTKIVTDAGGNGNAAAMFPKPGNWAGDFYLNDSAGKAAYQTFLSPTLTNQSYVAKLLPESKTNGGAVTTAPGQDPLSAGTLTCMKGSVQVTLKGASPSTSYSIRESETTYMDSSGTYSIGSFNTDANGDGSTSVQLNGTGGDLFQVESWIYRNGVYGNYSAGFIAGFSVP